MKPAAVHPTRRSFLKAMLAAKVATVFVPARLLGAGQAAPSNKVTLGVIGVGAQGQYDMQNFLGDSDVRVTAICDVNKRNIERAGGLIAKAYGSPDVKVFADFRELNADASIDAAVRSDTLCQLALIAVKRARRLEWDPRAERFVNDDAANAMLHSRAFRGDWKLKEA